MIAHFPDHFLGFCLRFTGCLSKTRFSQLSLQKTRCNSLSSMAVQMLGLIVKKFDLSTFSQKTRRASANYNEAIAEEAFYGLLGPKPSWLSAFLHKLHIKHLAWQWQARPKSSITLECFDSIHHITSKLLQGIFSTPLFPAFCLSFAGYPGGANSQGSNVELGLRTLGWAS